LADFFPSSFLVFLEAAQCMVNIGRKKQASLALRAHVRLHLIMHSLPYP
jgi:hypothetical protein